MKKRNLGYITPLPFGHQSTWKQVCPPETPPTFHLCFHLFFLSRFMKRSLDRKKNLSYAPFLHSYWLSDFCVGETYARAPCWRRALFPADCPSFILPSARVAPCPSCVTRWRFSEPASLTSLPTRTTDSLPLRSAVLGSTDCFFFLFVFFIPFIDKYAPAVTFSCQYSLFQCTERTAIHSWECGRT